MEDRPKQLVLFAPVKRRRRRGVALGRRPRAERAGFVPHVTRPIHEWRHPVHVTMRTVRLAPNLRSERVRALILRLFAGLKTRGVRVIHYSIQSNHLHLMVEAHDRVQLSRKMQLLFSRIALAVNRLVGRRGSLFRDRHHRVDLLTPTQTRNALVYILFNDRKHASRRGPALALDVSSSAPWFDGWDGGTHRPPNDRPPSDIPTTEPSTWLARTGWRRAGGAIRRNELPRS